LESQIGIFFVISRQFSVLNRCASASIQSTSNRNNSFNRTVNFCNNLLPNYQNLWPKCTKWLRRDAGASFRGGQGERVYGLPRIYDFSVFTV